MPQNETGSLDPQQVAALGCLLTGNTVTEAARSSGVSRETVHRWLREDFEFQAAYNRGRFELMQAIGTHLLATAHRAAANVAKAIEEGDLRASLAVLRGLGSLAGKGPVCGTDDPQVLREESEIAKKESQFHRSLRNLF